MSLHQFFCHTKLISVIKEVKLHAIIGIKDVSPCLKRQGVNCNDFLENAFAVLQVESRLLNLNDGLPKDGGMGVQM